MQSQPGLLALFVLAMALCAPLAACLTGNRDAGDGSPSAAAASQASEDPSEPTTEEAHASSVPPAQAATEPVDVSTPRGTLEAYLRAQENGDWAGTADFLTETAQDDFNDATENMTEDDLIAAGLRFREENYKLESSDAQTVIFYSSRMKLYLVMTREDDRWKIDPARTDRMNLEAE